MCFSVDRIFAVHKTAIMSRWCRCAICCFFALNISFSFIVGSGRVNCCRFNRSKQTAPYCFTKKSLCVRVFWPIKTWLRKNGILFREKTSIYWYTVWCVNIANRAYALAHLLVLRILRVSFITFFYWFFIFVFFSFLSGTGRRLVDPFEINGTAFFVHARSNN